MTLEEYKNDFCFRCKKCEGDEYHQYHCIDIDIVEESWEAAQNNFLDNYCKDCCNLEREKCIKTNGECHQYTRLIKLIENDNKM